MSITKQHLAATAAISILAACAHGADADADFASSGILDLNNTRTGAGTREICIDLQGAPSWDANGDISNFVIEQFLGAGSVIVGARWENVELTTAGTSFLNEAAIGFNNEVVIRVGAADNFSGSATYSSDGIFDFLENNIDYTLVLDGMLSLEFFETQDDNNDAADAFYAGGQLCIYYIPVPSPGSTAIIGMAGLVMSSRKRR